MSINLDLPDWVPWWVPLALLLLGSLYGLVFLFMPFSVLGVKARLESIDARLDEIQHEIRLLSLRLPDTGGRREVVSDFDDHYTAPPVTRVAEPTILRPPIPPAAHEMYDDDGMDDRPPPPPTARPARRSDPAARQEPRMEPRMEPRAEPRVNWPR